ncbi:MAG TPA: adenylate/guanylate cyclase domain-containing protein [Anaerolineae bacterium]|nr:AAA family ATPase [Anaerolineales bacterium]HRV91849.1 adenylate/guanylate cyclase domain-containing protein [Anaerolineae bacterium]
MDGLKCDVCGFVNPSDHFFCGSCGTEITAADRATSLINAPLQGDRRQVTIIFADISGFTALNDAAKTAGQVEQVVRLINGLLSELSEAIYEYDGYIDKYVGDEIMALFGAPTAHENDPELALRASLSMMERLKKFNENPPIPLPKPLGIHMGVNTGMVIAGMVGTDRKRSYTVMGDAVNVAARLESASVRGEILVNEDTYNLTNRLFTFEEREPIQVKGKAKPLKVYLLKGARDLSQTQRGLTGMEAPLIGREHEVEVLTGAYRQLHQGRGGIVTVNGDAGLGKTRLIAEVVKIVQQDETEQGSRWLFGRGLAYRQSFANRLFVDILYSYLQVPENADDTQVKLKLDAMGDELFGKRKDEVIPYLMAMLGVKLDSDVTGDLPLNDPQVLQRRIFVAMGEWVEALVTRQSLVFVFEDLHWADPSSVQLIEFLFTLTVYNPILIICVTRLERDTAFWKVKLASAEEASEQFQELTLWPLTNEESRQVIKHLLKIDPLPRELEDLLLSRAEGNPLFLEEVIRSLIEEGVIERVDEQWKITRPVTEIEIPNTLQGVLTARIDRLEEPVKRVLQIAAVIGRVFPHFILSPIVNDPEILKKALEQLEIADLIEVKTPEPEPEYIFKHVLTYETAYNSLLHQQRQLIHKQIGDYLSRQYWLLGEEYAPNVAEHYEKSEIWDRALRYLLRAAVAAIQSFANQQAITFYSRALEVAEMIGARADEKTFLEIYEGRAKIYTRLGEIQEAMTDYEAMLAKAIELNDDAAQMRALNGNGALQASHLNFTLASQYFQKALTVARRIGDKSGIADTLNQLGNFYYQMGGLDLATSCFREASEASTTVNYDLARLTAEDGLAKVMLEQGEINASLDRYEHDIMPLSRRLGYRSGLMNSLYSVLMGQVFIANYQEADATAQELLELHKKSGDFYRVPLIKYYQGLALLYQGYLDESRNTLQEGLTLAEEQEQKSSIALGLAWMGYSNLTVGQTDEGLQQAEQSVRLAHELGSPLYVMKTQSVLGTAYRHLNRLNEAVIELENVQVNAHNMGFTADEVMILYQLIRAYIDINEWDKAKNRLTNLLALAEASDMREFVARGLWLQSILATHNQNYDEAIEAISRAAQVAHETNSRLVQFPIQIQSAYVYQCAENLTAAREAVVRAQTIQGDLLNHLASAEIRQTFLTHSYADKLREIAGAVATAPAS